MKPFPQTPSITAGLVLIGDAAGRRAPGDGVFWRQDEPNTRPPPAPPDTTRLDYERQQAEQAWRLADAAASPALALPWLERAWRFTPSDQNIAFALASTRLGTGDHLGALALFSKIAARHATRESLAGMAAAALAGHDPDTARAALARVLAAFCPDDTIEKMAGLVTSQCAGWCGLTIAGHLRGSLAPGTFPPSSPAPGSLTHNSLAHATVTLDGTPIDPGPDGLLPDGWRRAARLAVTVSGAHLLGSPIDCRAIARTEGFVSLTRGGIGGWAWHPASPDTDPVLRIVQGHTTTALSATDQTVAFRGTSALARPRGFTIAAKTASTIRVLGADGRDLLGSPLGGPHRRIPAPPPADTDAIAIIVPVYRGHDATLACVRAVLASKRPADRLIVVNDASPDAALIAALQQMQADGALALIPSCAADPGRNLGFPGAANAGLLAAQGADAVLLNSDTVVYAGWLETLQAAVHSAPDIGTATPLSNDATIFTYPDPAAPAPMPDEATGSALAALALRANAGILVDVPTGHGFCLYIRAACLHATGLLRQDVFAQGYGEENDFCERAAALGWRHVAVPSVYVAHEGGVSFGTGRDHLLRRNGDILHRLHPTYRARIDRFIEADPPLPARARLDAARFAAAADAPSVLLISHGGHGGTTRVVRARAAALRASGLRPITLRGSAGLTQVADDRAETPNLGYHLPADLPALTRLLAAARPVRAEVHHLLGHGHAIAELLAALRIPYDVWVHDYQWICARLALVDGLGRFCGEPPALVCDACVAEWGDAQEVPIAPASLRARAAAMMRSADAVVTPSDDVSRRIRRHFPGPVVRQAAWEPDPPARAAQLRQRPDVLNQLRPGTDGLTQIRPGTDVLTVAVVGAIGLEKGYDVLLACARDAAARALPLHFAVAGYTIDDTPLLDTGHAFVTGPFKAADAQATIAALGAHMAFLPSIWPETWCYALSDMFAADLDVAVFDIGTPAERVRRTGRGWVLPLGLPAARVNDALLSIGQPAPQIPGHG